MKYCKFLFLLTMKAMIDKLHILISLFGSLQT